MPSLIDRLLSFFRPRPARPPPTVSANNLDEPARILNRNVLLLVYDPVIEQPAGLRLSQVQRWQRVENLLGAFIDDILTASGGLVRYQIAERINIDGFPVCRDGFQYRPETLMPVLRGAARPHQPPEADYVSILRNHRILSRVASGQADEVWLFAFPHAGLYESVMAGPGAFWCNGPPVPNTASSRRRFIIMGFSYERTVGEMLESYCHRVESIMLHAFRGTTGDSNLWERFTRYEKRAPGRAACGTVHFAPNSGREYEWDNPAPVSSECYDWLRNFPLFKADIRTVNAQEWGGGDIRMHHNWWLNHLPRVAGRRNGIHNNWWQYVADPSRVPG
jgi:hypothetical protein